MRRWIGVLFLGLLLAGCGSNSFADACDDYEEASGELSGYPAGDPEALRNFADKTWEIAEDIDVDEKVMYDGSSPLFEVVTETARQEANLQENAATGPEEKVENEKLLVDVMETIVEKCKNGVNG